VRATRLVVVGLRQRRAVSTEETDRPQLLSSYGVTNLAAEHLCVLYAENYGLPTVSLRYFTVYGPRQRPDMAFTRFCRAIAEGEQLQVLGTGDQVRDVTYVDDVVEANIRASTAPVGHGAGVQRGRRHLDHDQRGARSAG
jgi:UDP-glucuronate 4-epimerase